MSRLSRLTSYPITIDGEDIYFATDLGIQYQVYLTQGEDYIADEPFSHLVKMVGFRPMNKEASVGTVKDQRLHPTILKSIALSFERMPDIVLVYVCDMMDGRQRQRSMLFDRWFREFGEGYVKLAYTDNASTYCGMIFREGHPYTADLKEAVDLYIRDKEAL